MIEDEREELPLAEATRNILEECRMVLPGIQALFGFQLIAVINQGFDQKLDAQLQRLHLASTLLVAVAVALVMAPAAYHRQAGLKEVTGEFILVASRLLLWSMVPLMIGVSLEFYVVASVILEVPAVALVMAGLLLLLFSVLWFVLPRSRLLRKLARWSPRQ
ncbi:DUF6328 family protein [Geomesophilobacter sediminis]|uniref:Sodium:proton antiporter n=1 Tax=Geomesophilobacter sediminis TaxID=2798584 RepID=A0A8J7M208_9BACT|nr:DUF6328 family protein [Geomesophilobacter sediminis]MBJ6727245.1 hypothetical protein [Geomesophilobacter sediminis]